MQLLCRLLSRPSYISVAVNESMLTKLKITIRIASQILRRLKMRRMEAIGSEVPRKR